MANFDAITLARVSSVRDAANFLNDVRAIYALGKRMQQALALYQEGSDATFVAAMNALFSSGAGGERAELGQMLNQVSALITAWDQDHPWIGAEG